MKYLVDSDWIINGLAGAKSAVARLSQLAANGLAISVVTEGEVLEGAYRSSDQAAALTRYRQFFAAYDILPVTSSIVNEFARLRAHLHQIGLPIEDFDLIIAATAIHYDLELITGNLRHFERVPGLKLYRPDQSTTPDKDGSSSGASR